MLLSSSHDGRFSGVRSIYVYDKYVNGQEREKRLKTSSAFHGSRVPMCMDTIHFTAVSRVDEQRTYAFRC